MFVSNCVADGPIRVPGPTLGLLGAPWGPGVPWGALGVPKGLYVKGSIPLSEMGSIEPWALPLSTTN